MRLIQSSDFKPVSNAPYRFNILRFRRVELDLLTDLLNMHGNRRDVSQRLHIPDLAEEFFESRPAKKPPVEKREILKAAAPEVKKAPVSTEEMDGNGINTWAGRKSESYQI